MTVVTSFPAGTFPNAAPILHTRQTLARAFTANPVTVGGALVVFVGLAGLVVVTVARKGRDEQYLGVTPGLEPGVGQDQRTSRVPMMRRPVVAVQFTPPAGLRPGQLGTLIDEQANVIDVTATIIDLAVRGFLRIEEVEQPRFMHGGDWRLVMIWPGPGRAVAGLRDGPAPGDLRGPSRGAAVGPAPDLPVRPAEGAGTAVRRRHPQRLVPRQPVHGPLPVAAVRPAPAGRGRRADLAAGQDPGTRASVWSAWRWSPPAWCWWCMAPRMPARTAKGTALLAQAKGFRTYLETAEANQIKFEEGEDIFSRYLPFAIVFGVAERWAKVFAQLAASGAAVAVPAWYVGQSYAAGGFFNYALFGRSMDSFATTTSGSIAAATPSSSGSSGFGGGGFSGGGGGGGGGGSW